MIIFTVTNDLTYDARMHRICGTLATNGYAIMLVGRALPHSISLENKPFGQKRLRCFFRKGFPFYAEYNLRLFFFLLFTRYDAVCSIDLDTLPDVSPPCCAAKNACSTPTSISQKCLKSSGAPLSKVFGKWLRGFVCGFTSMPMP